MEKSAEMRKLETAINKLRNRYKGRKVIYKPSGTTLEYQAEILDMSYSPETYAADGTLGDWDVTIRYQTLAGAMIGIRTCGELIPVGWKA